MFDYFSKALDYEVILARTRQLKGARLIVALGGPTCWIDTEVREVICAWGAERASYCIDPGVCNELEEIIAECMDLDR